MNCTLNSYWKKRFTGLKNFSIIIIWPYFRETRMNDSETWIKKNSLKYLIIVFVARAKFICTATYINNLPNPIELLFFCFHLVY